MTDKESVSKSPEAAYVNTLHWEFNGHTFSCRGVTETVKDKLKDIFGKWKIGFDADKKDGKLSVNVTLRQFRRVEFVPDKITYSNGATDANLRLS